ncbi:MAG: TraR/DksA family transcriptional regulator [Gammaproteobacteria bacterium]|nr:MAG: TraR/DksA family transcriptional regulator [Gammaproteobacteria bacterium]RLA09373.1 MAG: TraR/DksA family transcriptional regulator [Gammaproteobacteria bacterium]RLA14227.1 MAG: TraR/DksA family transcriptional regulator [Gammaproteobacteria bacterium]
MSAAIMEQFRQQLLEMKADLQAQVRLDQQAQKPVELDQARVGRLSRMDALQGQQMLQEVARRRQAKLQGIDGALRRTESGDFGECFVCGNPIDPRRLAVDPTSTRCIGCVDSE